MALNSLFGADVPLSNYSLQLIYTTRNREAVGSIRWIIRLPFCTVSREDDKNYTANSAEYGCKYCAMRLIELLCHGSVFCFVLYFVCKLVYLFFLFFWVDNSLWRINLCVLLRWVGLIYVWFVVFCLFVVFYLCVCPFICWFVCFVFLLR